ncbi:MAG: DUF5058 family protein [Clostridia bacterium]|nr:DUF5058 family protein [Clostridia bacterium]
MKFNVNSWIIFLFVGIIIAFVMGQSIFFLVRALKRAKQKNMDSSVIKKTIASSVVFTIAPAIAIVIGVITLSRSLGVALPWLRLSIIGSLSYELVAAQNAMTATGANLEATVTDPQIFVTILSVMTLGIITGLILPQLFTRKLQKGLISIENRDKKWYDIFSNAMFIGMISAFLGFIFSNIDRLWKSTNGVVTVIKNNKKAGTQTISTFTNTSGLVPVFVMLSTSLLMCVFGILSKKTKARWINDFALPICLIAGMALAIAFDALLGGKLSEVTVNV